MQASDHSEIEKKTKDELLKEIERLQQENRLLKKAVKREEILTEQKSVIEEINSLANIVRQSSESIILTDLEGNIKYVNPMFETVTGFTFEEVKGKSPSILRSGNAQYPPGYYRKLWETIKKGKIWRGEFLNSKKNGEDYIEEASIFPVRDQETGEVTCFGAVKKDVTLPRELEKKLKKSHEEVVYLKEKAETANRLKSQFLSHMSHDIRTPLHAIMGYTNLLLKREHPPREREYLEKIKISGEGLLNLINDILDLSKIEAGQLDIYQQPFRLQDLMETLGPIFEIQFDQKNINFKINISGQVPTVVYHDKWRINQVLTNLLSNALKFTRKGRVWLRVGYKKSVDMLVFKVKDTGVGIPGRYLQQIFDSFSQISPGGDLEKKGTGLGLAICQNLITLMGGEIEVDSHPGKGSEFTVKIPANSDKVKGETNGEEGQVVRERVIADKRNIKILVAEDNLISRELMVEQLKEAGFNSILLASNGKDAMDMALEHSPDLILMDNLMPVMDGNTTIDQLKKKGYSGPVIILSGLAMREDINRSMNAGAVDYITKPIDFDQFFLKIGKYLNLKNGEVEETVEPSGSNHSLKPGADPGCEFRIKDGVSDKVRNIFLRDAQEKLDIITGILKEGDFENQQRIVKTIAHGYRGNAVHFGLSVLERAAQELEQAFILGTPSEALIQQTREMAAILKQILEENTKSTQTFITSPSGYWKRG